MIHVSRDELLAILHAHASALMTADARLAPEAALARSCALAVLIYDQVTVEAALRAAAQNAAVSDQLAAIVVEGGASAALTTP